MPPAPPPVARYACYIRGNYIDLARSRGLVVEYNRTADETTVYVQAESAMHAKMIINSLLGLTAAWVTRSNKK